MKYGIGSGALWGLDTVVLGIALLMIPFLGSNEGALTGALLHDVSAALILLVYMGVRGKLRNTAAALRTRSGKAVAGAAILGGPVGMAGYLIAIDNIGPGYTAIISSFYPAFGTLLAFIFLRERMRPRQLVALAVALSGIVAIGWTSTGVETAGNAWVGLLGALASVVGWGSEAVILAWGMRDDTVTNETALQIRQTTSALVYVFIIAPVFGIVGFTARAITTPAAGVIFLAAVAGTVSYLYYYKAINLIGAARGMALNISYSAWAIIFGLVLLGAVPTLLEITACIVILVGTTLAATVDWNDLKPTTRNRQKEEPPVVSGV